MVQAGAFQVKENADDLVAELGKKGFTSSVLEDTAQGRQRFRVLAGEGLTNDQAQAMLIKLTNAGYSGFVAAQKPDTTASSRQPSG
jgi:N-acetylmuramoyl-L-alanine amidase